MTNTNPTITQNNHLQNTTQKTKDWPTQTQLSLKQPSTKHYTENKTLTNTNPTITQTTISTKHYTENKRLTNTNPTITQTTIYKTLHRKLKIDQHKPHYHSNNHLQNITQKTKDWPTRTQLSLKQPSTKHLHRKLKIDQHEPNYHSNNHLQNTTQKTKDWPTRTQLSLKQPSTKHYTEN